MFSVVIPTINEEKIIRQCIDYVRSLRRNVEIIVSDGGSGDRTVQVAKEQGVVVCQSERGRGRQCNKGAAIASGRVLIFLHADTILPQEAFSRLEEIFENEQVNIGTFFVSFDIDHWLLRLFGLLQRLDPGIFRFGDQCFVVRKSFFDSIGGFSEYDLFEDMELIRRARKSTKVHRFQMTVKTSSRRFRSNGIIRQQLLNVFYTLLYMLGVSPKRLAREYERSRGKRHHVSLMVFVRFPHPGKVKTRLAISLSPEIASEVYRLCAETVFRESSKLEGYVQKHVFFADRKDEYHVKRWAGPRFYYSHQVDGTLGNRLENGFESVFRRGCQKAIVVASDVPDLSAKTINEAITSLDQYDIVIGPTYDGGYYLLGLKKLYRSLFHNISWSTEEVLGETLSIAEELGLSVHLLPYLFDIDTEEDLRMWMSKTTTDYHPILSYLKSNGYAVT